MQNMSTNQAQEALFYFRISEDKTGERLGVERQEPDSLKLCEERGFIPGERYIDNDLSATTGVERPDFERLLRDLKANPRPVIVWHLDRLLRLSKDLERVIDTGVNIYAAHAGYFDLSTPAGRAVARTVTAWSQYEGEQKAIRQKAAALQRAQAGKPWWPRRPFGFNQDTTLHSVEAPALAAAYDKVLNGVPLARVARDLNEAGLLTNHGNKWTAMTLRLVMTNARNAGLRVYKGEEIGPAGWEAIVPEETYRGVVYLLDSKSRKHGGGGPRQGRLTGLVRCRKCGQGVRLSHRGKKGTDGSYAVYGCRAGHTSMRADWLEAYVNRLMVNMLSSPEGKALWESDGVDMAELRAEAGVLNARSDELADAFADGELTREQFQRASSRLRERLEKVDTELRKGSGSHALHGPLSAAEAAAGWDGFPPDKQRTLIESFVETIHLEPKPKGRRGLRPGDVAVVWQDSLTPP